jgi:hypothetical protein
VDVTTGTEAAALSRDDEDSDVIPVRQLCKEVAQVRINVEREGVQLLRSLEGDRGDPLFQPEAEVLPLFREAGGRPERCHHV